MSDCWAVSAHSIMTTVNPSMSSTRIRGLSLEFRLYAWSLLADPLLFFVVLDQDSTGVNLTYGRLLQAAFLVMLFLRYALRGSKLVLPNPAYLYYRHFSIYLVLLLLSSAAGLIFYGSYDLMRTYDDWNLSVFSDAIRGAYSRPFFEVIILFYYFGYYIVLPKYILTTREKIEYFFKWMIRIFKLMLLLGFTDLVMQLTTGWYIPKHSSHIDFGYVGLRFHALLGEPRDAVPYLFYALSMVYIWRTVNNDLRTPWKMTVFCVAALVMTQSASGLVGFGLSAAGLAFFYLSKSIRRLILGLAIVIILTTIAVYLASMSPHIMQYYHVLWFVIDVLNEGGKLPAVAASQASNFLPFWAIWEDIKQLNLMPVLFGSGIGSVSFVNNNLSRFFVEDTAGGLFNPNSQITRIIYESGIVGTFIYIYALYYPLKIFLKNHTCHRDANFLLFMLLMGACQGHRSTAKFVYIGIVVALIFNWPRSEGVKVKVS
jgi:hypothetical protein